MASNDNKPAPPFPPQHQSPPGVEGDMDPLPQFQAGEYKPAGKLDKKVAIITGGDSGIGRAVATLFAREGAAVAITYLEAEADDAAHVKKHIEDLGGKCLALPLDVSDHKQARRAVSDTVDNFGRLDILVNNIATMLPEDNIEAIPPDVLERNYRVNLFSYYYMTQAALEHLPAGGSIINTGSIVGSRGGSAMITYAPAQGAIHALTKSLAKELLPRRIRVNCVAPGPVWTPLQTVYRPADNIVNFGKHNPIGRPAQPDEMAPAYVYFASNADSSYVTGEILFLTGGDVAR